MSIQDVNNALKNQSISKDTFNQSLKNAKADAASTKSANSIFDAIDTDKDGKISKEEWAKTEALLKKADANNDGKFDEKELAALSQDNIFKKSGTKGTDTFLKAMGSSGEDSTAVAERKLNGAGTGDKTANNEAFEYDSDGNLITYPKSGETFEATAKRLGIQPDTPEYEEFVKQNGGNRKWFMVGEEVKVPKSILDKIDKSGVIGKKEGEAEVQKWAESQKGGETSKPAETGGTGAAAKSGGTRPAAKTGGTKKPVTTVPEAVTPRTTPKKTATPVKKSQYPAQIQEKLDALKKNGDKAEVVKTKSGGYVVRVTDGAYMRKSKIGQISMNYDAKGNLSSYVQKYNNGMVKEITYKGGRKVTTKAQPAPAQYQNLAAKLQKKSGGNVRIEYNAKTKGYDLVQTNLKDKNIKEKRYSVNAKSWQQKMSKSEAAAQGVKDGLKNFSIKKMAMAAVGGNLSGVKEASGISAAMRNRDAAATLEDYMNSETVTYTNGKITQSTYDRGKVKKQVTLRDVKTSAQVNGAAAANSATTVNGRDKITSASEISFNLPADAPQGAKDFAKSLVQNKARLMKELNIDSDTYNMLAQTAIGIAGKETKFGQSKSTGRQILKDVMRAPSDSIALAQKQFGLENTSGVTGDWSQGMTQLKYTLHTKDPAVKKHMTNMGITNELQLKDAGNSAVGTMIVLAQLNKQIDTPAYQKGIKAAQGTRVSYPGYEMGSDGISRKSKDGVTRPWTNNITRQDVLCALWNGRGADVRNGTFKPQIWSYSKEVSKYTKQYKLNESAAARQKAAEKSEATRAFENGVNNGEAGGVVFMPAMYTDKEKHMNTTSEINELNATLQKKGIDSNLRTQLVSALRNGELGFDYGLRKEEINSLTNADIRLMLVHLHKVKAQVNNGSINTSDGISSSEAAQLRKNYSSTIARGEDNFRREYLNNHSKTYNASATNPHVLTDYSTSTGSTNYVGANGQRRGYQHETARGVNTRTTGGTISQQNNVLASSAYGVVKGNPQNRSGQCLTGVKSAMANAGIDVSGMSKYGSEPKYVKNWFEANSDKFTKVEYVSTGKGGARAINSTDLEHLPAGYIVIWEPEAGSKYGNQAGHIAITNGYGQGYSDATDNLGWGTYTTGKADSGKGEHGRFTVYKLSDKWKVNPSTGKLEMR